MANAEMNPTSDMPQPAIAIYSKWVHRLAVAMTLISFPLIWLGGMVTTYGAGMAVPDWPTTYGRNMFAYPLSKWLYGGFDLMVEHGHRLIGSILGVVAIALVVAVFFADHRRWFRWWCVAVLLAVVAQGSLGGIRVRLDDRVLAMIHGCGGQLFLAMATATAAMSSRWWQAGANLFASQLEPHTGPRKVNAPAGRWMAIALTMLLMAGYGQVVAGAQLRHAQSTMKPEQFFGFVHIHLTIAAFVLAISLIVAMLAIRSRNLWAGVKWLPFLILAVVLLQIALGVATWLVNYAAPWQELTDWLAEYTITSKGYWESATVTAHVATGAIIVSLSTLACLRAWRSRYVSLA